MNNFYRRSFWAFLSLTLIIGNVAIAFAAPNLSITALHLANMQRISRFEYEMDYRATVTNAGSQANTVTADLVVNNPATTIIGNRQLSFGNVAANSSKQSTNTIKIQHDRRTKLQQEHFVWTVNSANQPPVNQAPQVNAGANQTITLPAVANLTGTVTDDGLPNPPAAVTQSWAKVSGPGAVTFGNANARTTTATFAVAGIYVLKLTASDSVLSASDEVQIIVNTVTPTNHAPQITSTALTTATVDLIYSYDVNATDVDAGDTLTFSLVTKPTGMTINASSGLISWIPTAAQVGNQAVKVRVTDSHNVTADQNFVINVQSMVSGVGVITPAGGEVVLSSVAKIIFPANAFTTNTQVTVATSRDADIANVFNDTTSIFRPSNRLAYEIRINTGSQPPATDTIRVEIVVPDDFFNSVPAGSEIELFARLLSDGGEETLDVFDLFDAAFDSSTKTIVADLPTAIFANTWNNNGDVEAFITLAPTPGIVSKNTQQLLKQQSEESKSCKPILCPLNVIWPDDGGYGGESKGCHVSSPFNSKPKKPARFHIGVDYDTHLLGHPDQKIPVYAAASGTIEKVSDYGKKNYGKMIIIRHEDKSATLYGHLSSVDTIIKEGCTVTQGTQIGVSGNTGASRGGHLHFEYVPSVVNDNIWINKTRCNPHFYIRYQGEISFVGNIAQLSKLEISFEGKHLETASCYDSFNVCTLLIGHDQPLIPVGTTNITVKYTPSNDKDKMEFLFAIPPAIKELDDFYNITPDPDIPFTGTKTFTLTVK